MSDRQPRNIYSRWDGKRSLDLTFQRGRWLLGVHITRWQVRRGGPAQRTVRVYLGPLALTTWRPRSLERAGH